MGARADLTVAEVDPLGDMVLVHYIQPGRTKEGVLLPEEHHDPTPKAKVMKVGPGIKNDLGNFQPCTVKKGDWVIMPGQAMEVGENLYLVKDSQIVCRILNQKADKESN